MSNFKKRVTRIAGLSERRRLPRLGVIRLGLKAKSQRTGKEYPVETEYFVCPPEVRKIYGDQPKELDIRLLLQDLDSVFPCSYKHYGSSAGLKCEGDGVVAYRANDKREMVEVPCPCELLESGKCKQSGTLLVMLPEVSVGGVYQIRTSSINSIIDINSCLDYVTAFIGRFAMLPLVLRRIPTETHHDDKKQTHYTMQIMIPEGTTMETVAMWKRENESILSHPRYQLPAPLDENPELRPIDIVVTEEEEVAEAKKGGSISRFLDDPLGPNAPDLRQTIDMTETIANTEKEVEKQVSDYFSPEPACEDQPQSTIPKAKASPVKKNHTKMKAAAGFDRGMAVMCPEKPKGQSAIIKDICNMCIKSEDCPAWEGVLL